MDVQQVLHGEGRPKFYFSNNDDDISWSCELARVRCVGHVKGGARCRRNVIKGLDRCLVGAFACVMGLYLVNCWSWTFLIK